MELTLNVRTNLGIAAAHQVRRFLVISSRHLTAPLTLRQSGRRCEAHRLAQRA